MKRGVLLQDLAPLEKEFVTKLVETLLCRSDGNLVIDDELIGSRAKDVESKALSHRMLLLVHVLGFCLACNYAY